MSALAVRFRCALGFESRLIENVGAVVAKLLDRGEVWSNRSIREACKEAGVGSPTHGSGGKVSYGTVDRTLRRLRDCGALQWATAYVHRWHFDRKPEPGQPRNVWNGKAWRLPTRRLALGASWIERPQPADCAVAGEGTASQAVPEPKEAPSGLHTSALPIQPPPEAASGPGWFSRLVQNYGLGQEGSGGG